MKNKDKAILLRKTHSDWVAKNFLLKEGFFPVFYPFKEYLSELSGGAVSLFLYLGMHCNNKTGECYHETSTIANFFKKSPRTISSWFKELEDKGLIERFQIDYNGVAHTFIRPYHKES